MWTVLTEIHIVHKLCRSVSFVPLVNYSFSVLPKTWAPRYQSLWFISLNPDSSVTENKTMYTRMIRVRVVVVVVSSSLIN